VVAAVFFDADYVLPGIEHAARCRVTVYVNEADGP
jgi:hypothetical protein